ncbi:ankyrin repeat family protein [Tanacetum coccineum]
MPIFTIHKPTHHGNTVKNRLLKAIRKDDWGKAREIVYNNTEEVTWTSELDDFGFTALHYAVGRYKDNEVVRDIVMGINSELLLTIVDDAGWHPVHHAAFFGNTEALKIMLDSNPKCLFIPDNFDGLPINCALMIPAIKTFRYLFKQMQSHKVEFNTFLRGKSALKLLGKAIDTELLDVAYELINNYPRMAAQVFGKDDTPLLRIIRKPDLFYSGTHYNWCQRFVYRHVPIEHNSLGSTDTADIENNSLGGTDSTADIENNSLGGTNTAVVENQETPKRRCLRDVPHVKHLKDDKVKHNTTIKLLRRICEEVDRRNTSSDIQRLFSSPFCLAVENNTDEAIDVLTTYFRGLYNSVKDGHDIYQLTVLNRSEKVYIFIMNHKRDAISDLATIHDNDDNNILHFAGRLAPIHKLNVASGAALQMQRELQWFEEVKRVVGKLHTLNKNKETPMMVFRKEHKELRKDGEEWMKKTADSYTITAALIITIVFAAAITVPGGNDSATGKPIYETKASLIIFAISDAISLFTSTTSLLLFLSILTARYADEDFLYKLPKRLIYGLVMLFVSVTSMMIAFSATLYIMFGQGKAWILIPIAALACLPIASFVTLQFPLLQELISSTYGHGMFGKEKDYRQSSANANKKKRA